MNETLGRFAEGRLTTGHGERLDRPWRPTVAAKCGPADTTTTDCYHRGLDRLHAVSYRGCVGGIPGQQL